MKTLRFLGLTASLVLASGVLASGLVHAQVPATIVLMEGDTPMGAAGAVTSVRPPFINSLGHVGFTGIAGGVQFVWNDTGITWLDTDDMVDTLSSGDVEGMGISNTGEFVYGPLVNALGSVYTNNGVLFLEGDVTPGVANGTFNFLYMPRMLPNGDVWFVASVDTDANGFTDARVLYSVPGGAAANATIMLQTGDTVGAETLDTFGVDANQWDVSADGMHYISVVDLATGSGATDGGIVVDGNLIAQEASAAMGSMDNWDLFDNVAVNNAGDTLISGTTDGPFATDSFIAFNGAVVLTELDMAGALTFDGGVDALALNEIGHAAFVWDNGNTETIFSSCDVADMANTTSALLSVGDEIDIDGDGVGDHVVTNILASNSGERSISLTDDASIFVELLLTGGVEAIVELDASCCGDTLVTGAEDCDDGGESATCNADCTSVLCGDLIVNVLAGEDCDVGGVEEMFCDDDCTFPACGDGLLNMSFGEDCDDGGESASCDDDCTAAACGDGKLNVTAGEQCEDGNSDDGDGCSSTCQTDGGMGSGGSGQGGSGGSGQGGSNQGGDDLGGGGGDDQAAVSVGGCGCEVAGQKNKSTSMWLAALAFIGAVARRRRR